MSQECLGIERFTGGCSGLEGSAGLRGSGGSVCTLHGGSGLEWGAVGVGVVVKEVSNRCGCRTANSIYGP